MKILIIEDEKKLAVMLKAGLEKEGYAADYLMDGESGQRRIELHHMDYDLVLLDLMLPKRDGSEVCKNIREKNISIPILVLTAKSGTDDKINLLDLGADDYLVKPFSFNELLARIRALMRRPENSLPSELKIGDLALNSVTRKVIRNGREIKLTLKEFRLLEYLMRHPNQVVNRDQILDNLWDFTFDSFSNVVDVHMKNLRKKVENGGNDRLLETIRGVGYRIKV
jgi:DNA-binding response OmpR family regulator